MNKKEAVLAEVLFGLVLLAITLFAINLTSAAEPGHGAAYIGSGTFESGDYGFPFNVSIGGNFSVGIGTAEAQDE